MRFVLWKNQKLIKNQIAKIDEQKSRFMDLYGLGEFTIDELQKKTQPLNQQKADLEKELKALSQTSHLPSLFSSLCFSNI